MLLTDLLIALRRHRVPAAEALGELLAAYGPDRLMFGSGYPLVRPARLIRDLMTFRYPDELRGRFPSSTTTSAPPCSAAPQHGSRVRPGCATPRTGPRRRGALSPT